MFNILIFKLHTIAQKSELLPPELLPGCPHSAFQWNVDRSLCLPSHDPVRIGHLQRITTFVRRWENLIILKYFLTLIWITWKIENNFNSMYILSIPCKNTERQKYPSFHSLSTQHVVVYSASIYSKLTIKWQKNVKMKKGNGHLLTDREI